MKMCAEKLFILSPEYTGGIRTENHIITPNQLSLLEAKTPEWLKAKAQEPALFMPGLTDTHDMLFYILQQNMVAETTKEYGYAGYQGGDFLCLTIPGMKEAKDYMYYNALFALWDVPGLHQHTNNPHKDHYKYHQGQEKKKREEIPRLYQK